jgi:hypothetical protein
LSSIQALTVSRSSSYALRNIAVPRLVARGRMGQSACRRGLAADPGLRTNFP